MEKKIRLKIEHQTEKQKIEKLNIEKETDRQKNKNCPGDRKIEEIRTDDRKMPE